MVLNKEDKKPGIYCIKNIINNKLYIGKSVNIYNRIAGHNSDLRSQSKRENRYLQNSYNKYGKDAFIYFVLEYTILDEKVLSEKELYYMNLYNSTDKTKGYNLRKDSSSCMIVHQDTSKLISKRLKKEWANGIRSEHGNKLKQSWKNDENRKIQQSKLLSKLKTKYLYNIYDLNENFIKQGDYNDLKNLKINSCQSEFYRKKSNKVKWKSYIIERLIIKDMV